MATGEWSSKGKEAKKFNFEPFAAGEYELKLLGESSEVRKKQEPGSLPYVAARFAALGTATGEGGKDRLVFHNFFLSLKAGKDGTVMPERADALLGYTKALGEEPNFPIQEMNVGTPDAPEYVSILDAIAVKKWLIAHDGVVVKAKVKVDRSSKDYPAKNVVEFFIEAEGSQDAGDGGWAPEGAEATPEDDIASVTEEESAPPARAAGGKKRR